MALNSTQYSYLKEYLKSIVDVSVLLNTLGFKIRHRNSKEVRGPCLIHGGDNQTSFRMRLDTKTFSCYSRHCELTDGRLDNDAISLIMKVRGLGFIESVLFLSEICGVDANDVDNYIGLIDNLRMNKDIQDHMLLVERNKKHKQALPEVSEATIKEAIRNRGSYFSDMGIAEDIQSFFEVGFMYDDLGIGRAVIPIRDVSGRLVGLSGRKIDESKFGPKYLLMKDFEKAKVLYNLNNAVKVREVFGDCLIVVEGFKAVWYLCSCGFPNVVASMGTSITNEQALLAANNGFKRCFIMFDGDEAGRRGLESAIKTVSLYMRTESIPLWELFPNSSPDDLSVETIISLLDNVMK
jgi:DNA primase